MKKILIAFIIAFMVSFTMTAQDTIKIPQSELNKFFQAIDTLKQQDSTKTILISDLELQIQNYKTLVQQDSTLLLYRTQEMKLLNNQIKLYENRLKIVDRWYEKRWVGVIIGIVGTSSAIYLAGQIQ